jgi:hypothetical protein
MARIKPDLSILTPLQRIKPDLPILTPLQRMYETYGKDAPFQSGADLVRWLNKTRSGSPADREAAQRVRRLIFLT